ncbi:uncharacterized protein [Scyliorhinus torazame]|uniref:uncharacterized protein isoform X2 n=1 Tax=Scyliorhinus torazame TaxID=75743 RepID=UPI003B5C373F
MSLTNFSHSGACSLNKWMLLSYPLPNPLLDHIGPQRQAHITENVADLTAVKENTYEDVPPYLKEEPPEACPSKDWRNIQEERMSSSDHSRAPLLQPIGLCSHIIRYEHTRESQVLRMFTGASMTVRKSLQLTRKFQRYGSLKKHLTHLQIVRKEVEATENVHY